jgi:hypothetical protein
MAIIHSRFACSFIVSTIASRSFTLPMTGSGPSYDVVSFSAENLDSKSIPVGPVPYRPFNLMAEFSFFVSDIILLTVQTLAAIGFEYEQSNDACSFYRKKMAARHVK